MTVLKKTDIHKLLVLIRANFENAYSFKTEEEARILIEFWYDSLKEYPQEVVYQAVGNAIRHSEFAPKIANILNEIKVLNSFNYKTDIELWAELDNVLYEVYDTSRYLRYPQHFDTADKKLNEIYKALSEEIKLFVVNVSTLIEIAEMDDESRKFEKARFLKTMPSLREHAKNKAQAEQFLKLVGEAGGRLPISTDGGDKPF